MAINIDTDDLQDIPHIVCIEREGKWEIKEFDRGVEGQIAAHDFAVETMVESTGNVRVLVAARYRELKGG